MPVTGRLSPNLSNEMKDMLLRNLGLWCGIFKWKLDAFSESILVKLAWELR